MYNLRIRRSERRRMEKKSSVHGHQMQEGNVVRIVRNSRSHYLLFVL